ncbi:hypothetical protein PABG_12198 [Paracoccidioides brasiliensis Pb03]|nr:hypothetical protein PABG_12198 [Paracoccidioides brasiliensis Pb03]
MERTRGSEIPRGTLTVSQHSHPDIPSQHDDNQSADREKDTSQSLHPSLVSSLCDTKSKWRFNPR